MFALKEKKHFTVQKEKPTQPAYTSHGKHFGKVLFTQGTTSGG